MVLFSQPQKMADVWLGRRGSRPAKQPAAQPAELAQPAQSATLEPEVWKAQVNGFFMFNPLKAPYFEQLRNIDLQA